MSVNNEMMGVFGKLPAHGDFIQRNLSAGFINIWDEWLQHFVAGTKEQLGDDWLDVYLTSPLWRFTFSTGVIDENVWTGIMIPSVDRVGRYYPFSIIKRLPESTNPFEFIQLQGSWYKEMEMLALSALDGEIQIDELLEKLTNSNTGNESDYSRSGFNLEGDSFQFDMEFEEQSLSSVYPLLLDSIMMKQFQSYSIWQTAGSELIGPCFFSTQGLPSVNKMPAMLSGQWQMCDWQKPFVMNEFQNQMDVI